MCSVLESPAVGIEQRGGVQYDEVHYSDRFPVVRTACGIVAPSANDWRFVSCSLCLELRAAYRELGPEPKSK